jgi:DtxR family Mn-dependent transcriptional regulator
MTPLIDATEMYLRTVWELEEEGLRPIRARLVERLDLSAPAVSETVTRLAEEGLMGVSAERTLSLTDAGRDIAVSVMRKHRLAELLLTDVIGLEWERVHNEACRWEHVISDVVEARLVELLDQPTVCPHGNPIPGLAATKEDSRLMPITEAAKRGEAVTVERISEQLQRDTEAMQFLREHGVRPGVTADVAVADGAITLELADAAVDAAVTVPEYTAEYVYVRSA